MNDYGKILNGDEVQISSDFKEFYSIPLDINEESYEYQSVQTVNTIQKEVEVVGKGTFDGSKKRKIEILSYR